MLRLFEIPRGSELFCTVHQGVVIKIHHDEYKDCILIMVAFSFLYDIGDLM